MDDLIEILNLFLIFAFIVETMVLIGVFYRHKITGNGKTNQKKSIFTLLSRIHENNMNVIDSPRQLKDLGLKIIYFGALAATIEFVYTSYYMDRSKDLIPLLNDYFVNISPAFTLFGAGFAVFAFGVAVQWSEKK